MSDITIDQVRCEALFIAPLQPSDHPTTAQILAAVAAAVGAFGVTGCAARMAHEFGDHPDTAVSRMRWARRIVAEIPIRTLWAPPSAQDDGVPDPGRARLPDRGVDPEAAVMVSCGRA